MGDQDFSITEDGPDSEIRRLFVKGRVTSANADVLQYNLEAVVGEGEGCVVVNMQSVQFLSSAGIRVLLLLQRKAKSGGGSFFVERPSENVKNVLGMTALDALLLK